MHPLTWLPCSAVIRVHPFVTQSKQKHEVQFTVCHLKYFSENLQNLNS